MLEFWGGGVLIHVMTARARVVLDSKGYPERDSVSQMITFVSRFPPNLSIGLSRLVWSFWWLLHSPETSPSDLLFRNL